MSREKRSDYMPGGRPFTGRHFLFVMLAFFGVIIGVNGLMAFLAVENFRGVEVDSGFVASQDFNADVAMLQAQEARGWRIEASAPGGSPMLAFTDSEAAPIAGLTVRVLAERPTDQRADRSLSLIETAPGLYVANDRLPPGDWKLRIVAEGVGPRFAVTEPIRIQTGS